MSFAHAERPCAWCGKRFTPKTSRNRFCCRACGKKGNAKDTLRRNRERVRAALGTRKCDYCGRVYEPKRANSRTCSPECRRALDFKKLKARTQGGGTKTRACRLCGEAFAPSHPAQRFCGPACRAAYQAMSYRATVEERHAAPRQKGPTIERRCSYCGRAYMAYTGRSQYCSPECAAMAQVSAADIGRAARKAVCIVCGREVVKYTSRNIFCSRKCAKRASYCRLRIEGGHAVPTGKRYMRADDMVAARAENAVHDVDKMKRLPSACAVFIGGDVAAGSVRDEDMARELGAVAMMPEEAES